ncbi:MAG: hypothetical protein U1F30_02600 [Steroidobacteraceae bacterium]
MAESGTVESTLNFLMRCERGRMSLQVTLTRLRLFDYVALQRSNVPTVSRRIAAQGVLVSSPTDEPVFVDGQPITSMPLEVMLQFAPAGKYSEGRRGLGRLEFLIPRRPEPSQAGQPARLSLELLLPMELAERFTRAERIPVISVDVSGLESSMLDAQSGKGTHLWNTGTSPSLVVERCIVIDPE